MSAEVPQPTVQPTLGCVPDAIAAADGSRGWLVRSTAVKAAYRKWVASITADKQLKDRYARLSTEWQKEVEGERPQEPLRPAEDARQHAREVRINGSSRALNNACPASQPFWKEAASTNALRYFEKGHLRLGTTNCREP